MEPEEDCGLVDFGCEVARAAEDALSGLADDTTAAAAEGAAAAGTFWVNVPTPILANIAEDGSTTTDATVSFIQGSLWWYMVAFAVLSVIVAGIRTIWEQRSQPGMDLLRSLLVLIAVNGAGLAGLGLAVAASDAFALWIIDRSTDNFGEELVAVLGLSDLEAGLSTSLMVLGVAAVAAVMSCLQIVLLIVRNGFLVLLAGVWPTTAAATNLESGRAWFRRANNWLIAYLLYKPTAAICYATAFSLSTDASPGGGDPLVDALTGLTLMGMSIIALPALLKFVAPLTSAVAGSGSGAGGAAVMAAPAGAAAVRSLRGPSGAASVGAAGARGAAAAGPVGAAVAGAAAVSSAAQGAAASAAGPSRPAS